MDVSTLVQYAMVSGNMCLPMYKPGMVLLLKNAEYLPHNVTYHNLSTLVWQNKSQTKLLLDKAFSSVTKYNMDARMVLQLITTNLSLD